MATVTTQTGNAEEAKAPSAGFRPYRINTGLYQRMVATGAFGEKSHVFLWKGHLVEKISDRTKGRPHVSALNRLYRTLSGLVPTEYFVEQEQPLDLGLDSVPEPDLKVVRGRDENYRDRDPFARDVPLVAEVADSSLSDDTGEMLREYAAALIPVYWIVNIPLQRIDVHTRPTGPIERPRFESCQSFGPDDVVPVVLDGREVGRVPVKHILF